MHVLTVRATNKQEVCFKVKERCSRSPKAKSWSEHKAQALSSNLQAVLKTGCSRSGTIGSGVSHGRGSPRSGERQVRLERAAEGKGPPCIRGNLSRATPSAGAAGAEATCRGTWWPGGWVQAERTGVLQTQLERSDGHHLLEVKRGRNGRGSLVMAGAAAG